MDFRLLHISDIHLGPHVRCGDDMLAAAYQLAEEIAADLTTFKLLPVDAVVASGDFTFRADREEFEAARRFFERLSSAIGLSLGNFVFVPGNHDMAWYPPSRPDQPRVPNLRSDAKAGYETFFGHMRPGVTEAPACDGDIVFFRKATPPVVIVGFNSARFEDPRTAGLGYVGEGQILELLSAIREQGVDSSWRKIAVLHHHLLPVLDVDIKELLKPKEERKFTMIADAAGVLNLLLADGFNLALHGHMHNAFCAVERREALPTHFPKVSAGEIVIHGAGTVGMDNSEGDTENHYSVLSLREGRIDIESITRLIGPVGPPGAPQKSLTTVQLSMSQPRQAFQLPSKATIKHIRIREDARETWLDMYALARHEGGFRSRFKDQVRKEWLALGEDASEPHFTATFNAIAGKFTQDTLKEHERELETTQLYFIQYFLGLLRKRELEA